MRKTACHNIYRFTLVELLVGMAILLLMMGFLFQFVSGAQRIWLGSSRQAALYDQAQMFFSFLEEDLHGMLFKNETEWPGQGVPFYLDATAAHTLNSLFFISRQSAELGSPPNNIEYCEAYPVIYSYDSPSKRVYRCVVNEAVSATPVLSPWDFYGPAADPVQVQTRVTDLINAAMALSRTEADGKILFLEGVNNLLVRVALNATTHQPQAVWVTLTLYDAQAVKTLQENNAPAERIAAAITESTRIFNKVIFLR